MMNKTVKSLFLFSLRLSVGLGETDGCHAPLDIMFLKDTTFLSQRVLDKISPFIPELVEVVNKKHPNSRFGLSEFKDATSPRLDGNYEYYDFRVAAPLTSQAEELEAGFRSIEVASVPTSTEFVGVIPAFKFIESSWREVGSEENDVGARILVVLTDSLPGKDLMPGFPFSELSHEVESEGIKKAIGEYPEFGKALKVSKKLDLQYLGVLTPRGIVVGEWPVSDGVLVEPTPFFEDKDTRGFEKQMLRLVNVISERLCKGHSASHKRALHDDDHSTTTTTTSTTTTTCTSTTSTSTTSTTCSSTTTTTTTTTTPTTTSTTKTHNTPHKTRTSTSSSAPSTHKTRTTTMSTTLEVLTHPTHKTTTTTPETTLQVSTHKTGTTTTRTTTTRTTTISTTLQIRTTTTRTPRTTTTHTHKSTTTRTPRTTTTRTPRTTTTRTPRTTTTHTHKSTTTRTPRTTTTTTPTTTTTTTPTTTTTTITTTKTHKMH